MRKQLNIYLSICYILLAYTFNAQVSGYSFTQSNVTYTTITGGTVYGTTANDDENFSGINIGFTFTYNCVAYTQLTINANGYIIFGTAGAKSFFPISAGASNNVVSVLGQDLQGQAGSELMTLTSGSVGSRIMTIQWKNYRFFGTTGDSYNFQIKLYEGSNNIDFCYGAFTQNATNRSTEIGLRGSTNNDFNVRTVVSGTSTWATSTAGVSNNASCDLRTALIPASGQRYTFSTSAMAYVSSNVVQSSTTDVTKCDFDQNVICLQVVVSGTCPKINLTAIQLGMGGSTSATLADISNIHVYYTGNANTFNTSSEFVFGGTVPSGSNNTLTGSQSLLSGTNYFWIAYDISPSATIGNVIDASVTQFTVAGVNRIPTTTNPAGTRAITSCASYTTIVALGLKHWVKSDVGVTGSPVSAWADQSTAAITGNMVQGTNANRPSFVANAINFQPYIRFDGTNDVLASTNTFSGNALYSNSNNTILMVKNYKSGLVDYKWQTDPTNATRMGFELNGTTQRFDFVDDLTGKNATSSINITNKDVIVGGITDFETNTIRLNGNTDAINYYGGLVFSPNPLTLKSLYIGANDIIDPSFANVDIAEVMTFNKTLSYKALKRVESYLAIKYGITLGNNKGAGASETYMASDGSNIWDNQTGFHNNVIGIGRDNAVGNFGLHKLRSTSVLSLNSAVDILTIANGNNMGGSAFAADKSFFITGNNNQILQSTVSSNSDLPSGILSRLARVWKGQETGTVGVISLKFNLSTVVGSGGTSGANNLADVRLLIDQDGIFATGATTVTPSGFNNTLDTVVFQFDFTPSTGFYYTIGSVNLATAPLPIELIEFTATYNKASKQVDLVWQTASESNNDYFTIERSTDGINWEYVSRKNGAGNSSTILYYNDIDPTPYKGTSYYRLKQTDFDHSYKYSQMRDVNIQDDQLFIIQPNPSNNIILVTTSKPIDQITIYNALGQIVFNESIGNKIEMSKEINVQNLAEGVYWVKVEGTRDSQIKSFIKNK